MKNIIVFDDEILQEFSKFKPKISQLEVNNNWFLINTRFWFWMKVYDWRIREKVFVRYMFNRKKRIQKKWDKIYNDRFKINIHTPMSLIANCAV